MKKYAFWILCLMTQSVLGQGTFLGFDHPDCPDSLSITYTYENWFNAPASTGGFRILQNGVEVYAASGQDFNALSCKALRFVNDGVGFMVVFKPISGNALYRTDNYGQTWEQIASGAFEFGGMYIINDWTAYLVTYYMSPTQHSVYLSRGGILPMDQYIHVITDTNFNADIFKTDTLLNSDRCGSDSLRFSLTNGVDTIQYHINFYVPNAMLNEAIDENAASLYPNPALDFFSIRTDLPAPKQVAIYSTTGKIVTEFSAADITSNSYPISDLAKGTYVVIVSFETQKRSFKLNKY
ncbi:MAG: Secretion system C-terminal sorting domain [Bacteroidota bacterium]|jgi:hypothetical protein